MIPPQPLVGPTLETNPSESISVLAVPSVMPSSRGRAVLTAALESTLWPETTPNRPMPQAPARSHPSVAVHVAAAGAAAVVAADEAVSAGVHLVAQRARCRSGNRRPGSAAVRAVRSRGSSPIGPFGPG